MIFHENCLLADNWNENIIPYSFRKLGKMSQKLSSAAVVIGALRVNFEIWLQGYKSVFMLNSTEH